MPVTMVKPPGKDHIVSLFKKAMHNGSYNDWSDLYDELLDVPDDDPGYQAFLYLCPYEDLTFEEEDEQAETDWDIALDTATVDIRVRARDGARHKLIKMCRTNDRRDELVEHVALMVDDIRQRVYVKARDTLDPATWMRVRDAVVMHIVTVARRDAITFHHIGLLLRTIESFDDTIDAGVYIYEKFGDTKVPNLIQEILRDL